MGGGQQSDASGGPVRELEAYYVDALFRPGGASLPAGATTGTEPAGAAPTAPVASTGQAATSEQRRREVGRILRVGVINGELSTGDKDYLAQLVAQETGLPQADAARRVDEVIGQSKAAAEKLETSARDAAEAARHGARAGAIWSAIAMLVGAFCASLCATWGGKARDSY
jgi:hypothetical protein